MTKFGALGLLDLFFRHGDQANLITGGSFDNIGCRKGTRSGEAIYLTVLQGRDRSVQFDIDQLYLTFKTQLEIFAASRA